MVSLRIKDKVIHITNTQWGPGVIIATNKYNLGHLYLIRFESRGKMWCTKSEVQRYRGESWQPPVHDKYKRTDDYPR